MYGFRHPAIWANSFYVKLALRPSRRGWTEMLAAGSTSGRPVLIPTDEGRFGFHPDLQPLDWTSSDDEEVGGAAGAGNLGQQADLAEAPAVPSLYDYGTPLAHGHTTEVSALSWTSDGDLVTVSDDLTARCWYHEGTTTTTETGTKPLSARELRQMSPNDGQRWGCGWAQVEEGWDDDDG